MLKLLNLKIFIVLNIYNFRFVGPNKSLTKKIMQKFQNSN